MIIRSDFNNRQVIVTQDIFMILSIDSIDEKNEEFLCRLTTKCIFKGRTFKSVIITAVKNEKTSKMYYEMYYVKVDSRTLKQKLDTDPFIWI